MRMVFEGITLNRDTAGSGAILQWNYGVMP
jgi:hypothetical protein